MPGLEEAKRAQQDGVYPQPCHVTLTSGPGFPIFEMEGFHQEDLGLTF